MKEDVGTGWRDIESAPPADWSTDVDLWVLYPDGHGERITDCRASMSNGRPDWHARNDEWGWQRIYGTPTHWMPLPAPPTKGTSR